MSITIDELATESAELLPGREALGTLKFSFTRNVNVTKHIANVDATNLSVAANYQSLGATAAGEAAQSISITQ
ncbi:hypothetical protein [Actinospica robiniae]|uniref:hypothetical protein n=1 Tax=Actinospica robiniae TaxID=304901 RepID=UPI000409D0E0|nr:hypothetical protein [Actinospica robiniae]